MTTHSAVEQMGPLIGNVNVLERKQLPKPVNPAGKTIPYGVGGRIDQSCRLLYAAAWVASGVADLVAMPEAHVDANGVRKSRQWVNL